MSFKTFFWEAVNPGTLKQDWGSETGEKHVVACKEASGVDNRPGANSDRIIGLRVPIYGVFHDFRA